MNVFPLEGRRERSAQPPALFGGAPGGCRAAGGAHACTELSKPGRHRWLGARRRLGLQNPVTGLWGGVGFCRGDDAAALERNAKGTRQDAQREDTKGFWDQQRVKDTRDMII